MPKEDIFSKLKLKDYNKKLEEILDEKDFSAEVKNLLLSMFYKMETGYKDYKIVKQDVITKSELMEQLVNKINEIPYKIEVEKMGDQKKKVTGRDKVQFVKKEDKKVIKVYPNEQSICNAINRIDEEKIEMQSKYEKVRKVLTKFLISRP